MSALPMAWKGTLPILIGMPSRSHSAWVRPIDAICGRRVGGARHLQVVDGVALGAGDRVDRGDALVGGHVREQQAADDVADGVEVRLGGAHARVDLDEALLDLGARRLEAHVIRVRWRGRRRPASARRAAPRAPRLPCRPSGRRPSRRRSTEAGSKRALVMTLMPRRVNERSSSLRELAHPPAGIDRRAGTRARSRRRRRRGRSWRTRRPTAPAPTTIRLFGSVRLAGCRRW